MSIIFKKLHYFFVSTEWRISELLWLLLCCCYFDICTNHIFMSFSKYIEDYCCSPPSSPAHVILYLALVILIVVPIYGCMILICDYVVFVVWIGSTSFARTQGQTQTLRLYSQITHVPHQTVLLHQHLSISLLPQLQSLLLIPHLELMEYDIMRLRRFYVFSPFCKAY